MGSARKVVPRLSVPARVMAVCVRILIQPPSLIRASLHAEAWDYFACAAGFERRDFHLVHPELRMGRGESQTRCAVHERRTLQAGELRAEDVAAKP